jgi:DNA-binding winged helix-turn-helix (wHTH) protein
MDFIAKANVSFRFDDLVVDADRFRVEKDGRPRKITPRAFDVLVYLIEHRDRIVEKQELFEQIWKESFVSDNALTRTIKEIRQVIGDDAEAPHYIETVHKRGYRFIAAVTTNEVRSLQEAQTPLPERPTVVHPESPGADAVTQAAAAEKSGVVKVRSAYSKTRLFGAVAFGVAAIAAVLIWRIQGTPDQSLTSGVLRNMQITTWPGLDAYPALAPDGKRIAYSAPTMKGSILSIPLATDSSEAAGAPVSLTPSTSYRKGLPRFSPDGRRIAYVDFRGGTNQDVWVMDADGQNPLQLTTNPAIVWGPGWFPDNDRIAFQNLSPGQGDDLVSIYKERQRGSACRSRSNNRIFGGVARWKTDRL